MKRQNYIDRSSSNEDIITCFVCHGTGKLSRAEILKELGGKEFFQQFTISEEQFFNKLETSAPLLIKEIKEVLENRYKGEIEQNNLIHTKTMAEKVKALEQGFSQEIKKYMEEAARMKAELNEEKKAIEALKTKNSSVPSLKGVTGEKEFKDWIGQYSQFECSDKLTKTGDYILKLKRFLPNGNLEVLDFAHVLIDCKQDLKVNDDDIDKLFRDARLRKIPFAYLLVKNREQQFRGEDYKQRLIKKDGILLFKGDKTNLLDDMCFLEHFAKQENADTHNYRDMSDSLRNLLMEKVRELDEFKGVASNICREAEKINKLVDDKKRAILKQVEVISNQLSSNAS